MRRAAGSSSRHVHVRHLTILVVLAVLMSTCVGAVTQLSCNQVNVNHRVVIDGANYDEGVIVIGTQVGCWLTIRNSRMRFIEFVTEVPRGSLLIENSEFGPAPQPSRTAYINF